MNRLKQCFVIAITTIQLIVVALALAVYIYAHVKYYNTPIQETPAWAVKFILNK